ncbi:hypothetical protein LINPERPRIM_LOCUS8155 [Linum perenne]
MRNMRGEGEGGEDGERHKVGVGERTTEGGEEEVEGMSEDGWSWGEGEKEVEGMSEDGWSWGEGEKEVEGRKRRRGRERRKRRRGRGREGRREDGGR